MNTSKGFNKGVLNLLRKHMDEAKIEPFLTELIELCENVAPQALKQFFLNIKFLWFKSKKVT